MRINIDFTDEEMKNTMSPMVTKQITGRAGLRNQAIYVLFCVLSPEMCQA